MASIYSQPAKSRPARARGFKCLTENAAATGKFLSLERDLPVKIQKFSQAGGKSEYLLEQSFAGSALPIIPRCEFFVEIEEYAVGICLGLNPAIVFRVVDLPELLFAEMVSGY